MSDDVQSVIPTDPEWQPDRDAADRAASLVKELTPGVAGGVDMEIDVTWNNAVTAVDYGGNLESVGCPMCQASIDMQWSGDLLEANGDDSFTTPSPSMLRAAEDKQPWTH
ncbi:hypothetical protein [Streptomyces sp. NBC_00162]|uniref:hypothetical protein n=1 Tax=Streptomyces sp. NBC_00162 TaxID=2903629 RepID=UPI00214C0EC0|nr:hypothetical protein [Streptomyces sp. NBC_00162]UUU38040.1 hypothetical protein JIW86_03710 [Streptomyces sp. NBC_00162]